MSLTRKKSWRWQSLMSVFDFCITFVFALLVHSLSLSLSRSLSLFPGKGVLNTGIFKRLPGDERKEEERATGSKKRDTNRQKTNERVLFIGL